MNRDSTGIIEALVRAEALPEHQLEQQISLVTISRDCGAGGEEVGRLLAGALGVQLYNEQIVEAIASDSHLDKSLLEELDDKVEGLRNDWLQSVLTGKKKKDTYLKHLINVVLGTTRTGAVVMGRGAHLILCCRRVFRVRIVGTLDVCVQRVADREGTDLRTARRLVKKTNRQRAEFVQTFFHQDIADPNLYDLVINTDYFEFPAVANIILYAMRAGHYPVPKGAQA